MDPSFVLAGRLKSLTRVSWTLLVFRFHQADELVEQIHAVVRTGAGLWVILHRKDRQGPMMKPFQRLIIQVDVGRFHVRRKGGRIDGETMILRGDLNSSGPTIKHRLVGATMSKLQLESLAAEGLTQKLMAEANPEDWLLADELPNGLDRVIERLGIAWAVRKEDAVWLASEDFIGRR